MDSQEGERERKREREISEGYDTTRHDTAGFRESTAGVCQRRTLGEPRNSIKNRESNLAD